MRLDSDDRHGTRLRVLIIDHTAELSGAEVALARLLHAIDRERFDVSVLLLSDGPLADRLRGDGVPVAVLRASDNLTGVGRAQVLASPFGLASSGARTVAFIPRLTRAIRGAHPDLVIANTLKSAVFVSIAARLARRPWVWHLHDRLAKDYLPVLLVLALRTLARRAPRAIIANSRATRDTVTGVPDARISVAYPGLEVGADVAELASRRSPEGNPRFGLLGRIGPTKGQTEFLHAAAEIASDMPEAIFCVIGDSMFNDGDFALTVRTLPELLGITHQVDFTGWVSDPMAAVADLSVLVHASPIPEPFGQVLLEGMLAGIPVIGTNAGGVPEILDPDCLGQALMPGVIRSPLGLLVEPGNIPALASAMRWMIAHMEKAEEMAVRARASAMLRFDLRRSARHIEKVWMRAARASLPRETDCAVQHRS